MADFHFTGRQLIENGWDGNLDTLDQFKEHLKEALELGWNPEEMNLMTFYARLSVLVGRTLMGENTSAEDLKKPLACELKDQKKNDDDDDSYDDEDDEEEEEEKDDYESRRRRAEQAGWDEDEMDLEEFEDYYL